MQAAQSNLHKEHTSQQYDSNNYSSTEGEPCIFDITLTLKQCKTDSLVKAVYLGPKWRLKMVVNRKGQ